MYWEYRMYLPPLSLDDDQAGKLGYFLLNRFDKLLVEISREGIHEITTNLSSRKVRFLLLSKKECTSETLRHLCREIRELLDAKEPVFISRS